MKHCALFLLLAVTCLSGTLRAQVPRLVNYQGRVAVNTVNFDGAGQFKFALVNSNSSVTYCQCFQRRSQFPRNEPPNFTEYLSERPEMTTQWREVTEGQNKKNQINQRNKR